MKVYVIKNIQNDIYGIYKHEKTVEFVKDNLNSKNSNESPFYYIEAHEFRDDY